ncbi:MAG TPA: hypothetical protein VNO30_43745 [Kofleriaceae bacterium]|nr:hypothetical protein [Kofleriaceae bacterium]
MLRLQTRWLARWIRPLRRALIAPGNLAAGAGALALAAVAWNPLPLILYALGEPVWLYRAARGGRYTRELADAERARTTGALERELAALVDETPCGAWIHGGHLPDYPAAYAGLTRLRAQLAAIVAARDGVARPLEDDVVARLDDMLRGFLALARERLLFHCALAKIYPELPGDAPRARPAPPCAAVRFVSVERALGDVRARAAGLAAELGPRPELEEVYRPVIETLERRCEELAARGDADRRIAAQLAVFPDQFELVAEKLSVAPACAGQLAEEMKLLAEQTDDAVRFAEDLRGGAALFELAA